jgi:hypothetical protein
MRCRGNMSVSFVPNVSLIIGSYRHIVEYIQENDLSNVGFVSVFSAQKET